MRRSNRYQSVYYRQKHLLNAYDAYKKVKIPHDMMVDSLEKYKGALHEKEFDLKLLKRKDTLKYYEEQLIDKYQEEFDDLLSEYEGYQEEVADLKEELKREYAEYQELLKPFDDSMKIVFNKKVKMKLFHGRINEQLPKKCLH